jgi:N,N'-diacetyllegionaminate synthase
MDILQAFPKPLIISELGAKYASMEVMEQMVSASRQVGADMVKFQTYRAATLSTPGSFFTMEDGQKVSQYDFFQQYELGREEHERLIARCKTEGLAWLSTPSHTTDVDMLEELGIAMYKTGSDDLTNLPFLRYVAERQKPMLVSTGMSSLGEVEAAVEAIMAKGCPQLILLHCVSSYPAKHEDANLRAIETLRAAFGLPIGLSDHTTDEFTSVLATQMGAVVIEKHFTLDHALKMPDHQASLDPEQFKRLVDRVRLVPKAMGDGVKRVLGTEQKWREAGRKSLFSAHALSKGQIIAENDIAIRRPGSGLHPHRMSDLMGRPAARDIPANTLLGWEDFA